MYNEIKEWVYKNKYLSKISDDDDNNNNHYNKYNNRYWSKLPKPFGYKTLCEIQTE